MKAAQNIEQILTEADSLLARIRVDEAEKLLRSFVDVANPAELRHWEVDLRKTIDKFLPQRKKRLTQSLNERLLDTNGRVQPLPSPPKVETDVDDLRGSLKRDLQELSDHHIFQWSTYYRDTLFPRFREFVKSAERAANRDELLSALVTEVSHHSYDIFSKGLNYLRSTGGQAAYVQSKAYGGVQKFLELPVEYYSATLNQVEDVSQALALRGVTSSILRAILSGFGAVKYWNHDGWSLLAQRQRFWMAYLGFFSASDLTDVVAKLDPAVAETLQRSALPVAAALDQTIQNSSDYIPMPVLGNFLPEQGRMEISLRPPTHGETPQGPEIWSYVDGTLVNRAALLEASSRDVSVVLVQIRSDLRSIIQENEKLKTCVVEADETGSTVVVKSIRSVLELDLYRRVSPRAASAPLRYNFARDFPLHNPFLTQYFRVRRNSVKNLLKTFERRNGVRLWCSVRRSGKTTACFDLGSTSGGDPVVSQTCDSTEQTPDSNLFYDSVCSALANGSDLPKDFVRSIIGQCAGRDVSQTRCVFVLDEYETLFGRLAAEVTKDTTKRYSIVQPLLNQLVAFSRDNLLVLLGQQPDAHYILMDQNQLSAYVEQDAFPLFAHSVGSDSGEFAELVQKVLTTQAVVEPEFLNELYAETSGHPYLTVKLLIDVVDWLIQKHRRAGDLRFSGTDFREFASERLISRQVALNKEYQFFRSAAGEAMKSFGLANTPWLHVVYNVLRQLVLEAPASMRVTFDDFDRLVATISNDVTTEQVLRSAEQANFLVMADGWVGPKIPLLARIAASARQGGRG